MASRAQITITVTKTRSASNVTYSTKGRYAAIDTNQIQRFLTSQPLYTTASQHAFWAAVLAVVAADVAAQTP